MTHDDAHNPWLHRTALLTACCTFVLIFIGGLVTSKHAGMSVPDWPNSYGYNMFLFPPSKWVGGILFEHTHRLMGTVVGFCATMMTLLAWAPGKSARGRKWIIGIFAGLTAANVLGTAVMGIWPRAFHLSPPASDPWHIISQGLVSEVGFGLCAAIAFFCRVPEPRRWVRWVATACLIAICIQGLLGGLRVDLINLTLAMVHGCFAQASFCLIIFAGIVTGKWWKTHILSGGVPAGVEGSGRGVDETLDGRAAPGFEARSFDCAGVAASLRISSSLRILVRLAILAVCVVYGQLIIGAVMRHLQAGLAIPDLPLAYGKLLPPMNDSQLAAANHLRVWKLDLEPVTLGQVWLHFAHRIGAIVVTLTLSSLIGLIFVRHRDRRDLVRPASLLAVLLLMQVTLGILTVYLRKPADVASSHVACGALVLGTTFFIAVRAVRLYSLWGRSVGEGVALVNEDRVAEATAAGG